MHRKRNLLLIVCGLAALLLLGCQEEEIRSYRVPKPEATRLLAAIIPHGDGTWFFKLVGPEPQIAEHQEAFDQFLHSIRFTDQAERPITWTVPQGWRPGPEAKPRYATFFLGSQEHPLELTIFNFSGAAGSVLGNVNRWRGQIGLREISGNELGQISKNLRLDCGPATLVDMTNRRGANAGPTPAPDILSRRAESHSRLHYDKPEGWKEKPDPKRMRLAVFDVADGAAEAGIMVLSGEGGGLLANINRWRGQVQLEAIEEEQLRKEVRQLEVAGTAAHYVDLSGPASAERPPQRLLGVVLPHGQQTWFFTLKGPPEVVAQQKAAFEALVKSVRFEGGRGN